jgi:hypothetical protein
MVSFFWFIHTCSLSKSMDANILNKPIEADVSPYHKITISVYFTYFSNNLANCCHAQTLTVFLEILIS